MTNLNEQTQIRQSWLNGGAPVKLMVASLGVLAATITHSLAQGASYDANVKLTLHLDGPNLAIHWPSQSVAKDGTTVFPWFEVQTSTDSTGRRIDNGRVGPRPKRTTRSGRRLGRPTAAANRGRTAPTSTVEVTSEAGAKRVLRLLEVLDDHDDVQNVYANFDMPDEVLAAYGG